MSRWSKEAAVVEREEEEEEELAASCAATYSLPTTDEAEGISLDPDFSVASMGTQRSPKDNFFEKVINPYLLEVMKHSQTIEMHEGLRHICDVQGPKKEGSEKSRLTAVEQEIFKCKGMLEHGLITNHSMITNSMCKNKKDKYEIADITFNLHDTLQDL
ncbi:40S ribosomal protein S5-1 [Hordeum vulgare]|nr:40S ribosomal protein S5-1 [Hordeum vulgare]